jgi:3-phosphoshikimate 1-carboxyvinyltransferase
MIKDAQELKVKESNRLDIMVKELQAMGVNVEGTDDGMIIQGGNPMNGTEIESYLDHRIAMAFSIAGLVCEGETTIKHSNCIDISYPGFYKDLAELSQD